MTDQITIAIVTIIAVLVGYYLGKGTSPVTPEMYKQVEKKIKSVMQRHDVGAIERPTVVEIERNENPIKSGEDEAMAETLREIIQ